MEKVGDYIVDSTPHGMTAGQHWTYRNREEVLAKLSSDEHYYGDYGGKFLSNSNISQLINNPTQYSEPREDSVNLMFGRAFHELIMFGKTQNDNYIEASTRNTNKYKEASAEAGGLIFLKKEWDDLNLLVDTSLKNETVKQFLNNKKSKYEVPNFGTMGHTDSDVLWKCKADIVTEDSLIDIKTSSSLGGFKYSSKAYNYDSQAFIYSTMFQKPMKFLVIEKGTGCVGLYEVSDDAYDRGREKVSKAEENYLKYFVNKSHRLENFTVYGEI